VKGQRAGVQLYSRSHRGGGGKKGRIGGNSLWIPERPRKKNLEPHPISLGGFIFCEKEGEEGGEGGASGGEVLGEEELGDRIKRKEKS